MEVKEDPFLEIAFELNVKEIAMQKSRAKGAPARKIAPIKPLRWNELGSGRTQDKAFVLGVDEVGEYLEMWSEILDSGHMVGQGYRVWVLF